MKLSDVQYKCKPCNKSFTGVKSYAEHKDSEQHRRRCGEISSVASPPSPLPSVPDSSPSQNPNSKPYKCLTCNERFPGPESYEKHGDFSIDGKGCLSGALSSPAIKNLIQCNACNTDISGIQNMKEHDKGKKHRKALAVLQGSSSVCLDVPADKSCSSSFTVYKDMPSSPLMPRMPNVQSLEDDNDFSLEPLSLDTLNPNTFSSNPHNVPFGSISFAARVQVSSTNNKGKHSEAVRPVEDRDEEQYVNFISSAESRAAANIGVNPVYSDDGTKCEVGGLTGYGCKKCGILLFLNIEAAKQHYRSDSHRAAESKVQLF